VTGPAGAAAQVAQPNPLLPQAPEPHPPAGSAAECPDCGLALGAPADAAPDEAEH